MKALRNQSIKIITGYTILGAFSPISHATFTMTFF